MFKIDWPCAIGGVIAGYYTKAKVENTKAKFRGIYTAAVENLKDSFEDTQADKNGKKKGN